jgi:hypothetical protein
LDHEDHRLAVDGDTLYAALQDGSIVAVDLATGAGKWWSVRPVPGQVQIYAVDGTVVAVDVGDLDAIDAQIDAGFEAARSGTPLPATPTESTTAACVGMASAATPNATPSPSTASGAVITTYKGLDTNTGEVRWSTMLPAQSVGQTALENGVIYEVIAVANWPAEQAQVAVCLIDPVTGQVRAIDNLDDLPGRVVLFKRNSDPATWSIGMFLENEQLITVPAAFDPAITGPVITLDETFSNGWQWNEIYENGFYASMLNGDLVKIPIQAE